MHLSSHLVHISNVRSVIRVRVDTHTDQFPKLQGKTVLLVLECTSDGAVVNNAFQGKSHGHTDPMPACTVLPAWFQR